MRISENMISNLLERNLTLTKDGIYDLQEKVTSGKQILVPSDDPGAYETILRIRSQQSALQQKITNSDNLSLDLSISDGVLSNITDMLHRTSELVVMASDGSKAPADRVDMGLEVDMMLNQLVDLANSNLGGRYIYGGLRTDTPPYTIVTNAEGRITAVNYQGNTGVREVEINQNIPGSSANKVDANIPGSDITSSQAVFQNNLTDIFKTLIRVRDGMLNQENPITPEDVPAAAVDTLTEQITVTQAYETGTRVTLGSDGAMPAPLINGVPYYAIFVDATHIQLAATYDDAINGVAIDLTTQGTGTHQITKQQLGELNVVLDHISSVRGTVGANMQRVSLNNQLLGDQDLSLATTLGAAEDIDIAKTMIELSQRQTAYEAALRMVSTTLRMSLVDFM
ncbi:MAG: flagellar hook-associated protein FlgL [Lentisphaerae bacterium]|nr:flagellar hook-associated protein FlgL [Lentisphaerota bacterium]